MTKHLHVGGLVAAGLDPSGQYLLTVSHSGRGVWSTTTWERVARDSALAYPIAGRAIGIGPIEGASIQVTELEQTSGTLAFASQDGFLAGRVVRVNLADQKNLIAPARDCFANEFLGSAFSIHLRGIDESCAETEPEPKRSYFFCPRCLVLSHHPSTQAEGGHLLARGK